MTAHYVSPSLELLRHVTRLAVTSRTPSSRHAPCRHVTHFSVSSRALPLRHSSLSTYLRHLFCLYAPHWAPICYVRHLYVTNATHGEVGNGLDAEGFAFKVINKGRGAVEKWLYLHVESGKTNGVFSCVINQRQSHNAVTLRDQYKYAPKDATPRVTNPQRSAHGCSANPIPPCPGSNQPRFAHGCSANNAPPVQEDISPARIALHRIN